MTQLVKCPVTPAGRPEFSPQNPSFKNKKVWEWGWAKTHFFPLESFTLGENPMLNYKEVSPPTKSCVKILSCKPMNQFSF